MKKRIIFRADAGKNVGFGHFIRTLSLASYLRNEFDCYFTSYNHDNKTPSEYQLKEISKFSKYLEINASSLEEYDAKFLDLILSDDIIYLDNYYFTTTFQKQIKEKGCILVSMDDLHKHHFVSDLIISFCPDARDKFDIESYTYYVGGLDWIFLRPPFTETKLNPRHTSKIKTIVLSIGGADPYNLTEKYIELLLSFDEDLEINVIAGDTVKISKRPNQKIHIHRRLSAEEIVSLFDRCDIGIFPVSTICFEALSRGLPVIGGWFIDNQKEFYDYASSLGLIYPIGEMQIIDEVKKQELKSIITGKNIPRSQKTIDFKGRIQMLKDIINKVAEGCYLREVRLQDKDILFKWANDETVRANSFNTKPITYEEHCKWFERMLTNPDVSLYILVDKGQLIGQVRLNRIISDAEIGYSIAKEFRGKGYGNRIIELITNQIKESGEYENLIAKVKPENSSSNKIFIRNGFTEDPQETDSEKIVYKKALRQLDI